GIAVAATNEDRLIDPALARLQHLHAGNLAQRLQRRQLVLKLLFWDDRDRRANLSIRNLSAGSRHHNLLRDARQLESKIDRGAAAAHIHSRALLGRKSWRFSLYLIAAWCKRAELIFAFRIRNSYGNGLAIAQELHLRAGDGGPKRISDCSTKALRGCSS